MCEISPTVSPYRPLLPLKFFYGFYLLIYLLDRKVKQEEGWGEKEGVKDTCSTVSSLVKVSPVVGDLGVEPGYLCIMTCILNQVHHH